MPDWIMASPVKQLQIEWRRFKEDAPGERFQHQRDRARERSRSLPIVLAIVGVIVVALGVVMLFVPGPGILVIALGLAMIGSASRRVAQSLDRVETWARRKKAERDARAHG